MSKWTKEEVSEVERILRKHSNGPGTFDYEAADMLREYAATLEQQAEWPSDADVEHACKAAAMEADGAIFPDAYSNEEADDVRNYMRAALQSVRPPASAERGEAVGHGYFAKGSGKLGLVENPDLHHLPHVFKLYTAPPPAAGVPDGFVLVAIKRREGYEDVYPEFVAEDCMQSAGRGWCYQVLSATPSPAIGDAK